MYVILFDVPTASEARAAKKLKLELLQKKSYCYLCLANNQSWV